MSDRNLDWDVFKKAEPVPFFSSSTYEDSVKERLKESVVEYTGDDQMTSKLAEHLCEALREEYEYYQDQATKIKSVIDKLSSEVVVF